MSLFNSAWASTGGIVGRGILLDYASWATKHSLPLNPLSSTAIPFSHLQHVITEQGVCVRPGDIVFIRCGFTAAFDALSQAEQLALSKRPSADFLGVEPTVAILEWLWESQIAAVAGDSPAFESSPLGKGVNETEGALPVVLHQWLLGGWGMPIGEMFDLEELAKQCRECGRWSFFLSSVPLKVSASGSQVVVAGTAPSEIHGKILICIYRYLGVLQVRRTRSLSSSGMQLQGTLVIRYP